MEGTLAVVTCFAGNFAPRFWMYCNGQILSIAQNTALFSLLGTTYGGNGQTTFALPNLQGRTAIGTGQGPGLTNIVLGEVLGNENTILNTTNIPPHVHNGPVSLKLKVDSTAATNMEPDYNYPAGPVTAYNSTPTTNTNMLSPTYSGVTIGIAGGSQPFSNRAPYLGMNYIICTQGIFPSRN